MIEPEKIVIEPILPVCAQFNADAFESVLIVGAVHFQKLPPHSHQRIFWLGSAAAGKLLVELFGNIIDIRCICFRTDHCVIPGSAAILEISFRFRNVSVVVLKGYLVVFFGIARMRNG